MLIINRPLSFANFTTSSTFLVRKFVAAISISSSNPGLSRTSGRIATTSDDTAIIATAATAASEQYIGLSSQQKIKTIDMHGRVCLIVVVCVIDCCGIHPCPHRIHGRPRRQ